MERRGRLRRRAGRALRSAGLLLCALASVGFVGARAQLAGLDAAMSPEVSGKCAVSLRKYLLCGAISGLFSICHQEELFNNSRSLRQLVGCDAEPNKCQERCVRDVNLVTNESVAAPCSADFQAMHGFSAPLNIFTVGQIDDEKNTSKAAFFPLPNIKNLGGASLISYGEPGHCAEIPSAHYCVLSGQIQVTSGMIGTSFALGACLPNACSEEELRSILMNQNLQRLRPMVQCDLVRPKAPAMGASAVIQDKLGWGGIPVYYPYKADFTPGFVATTALILVLVLFAFIGTSLDVRRDNKKKLLELAQAAARSGNGLTLEGRGLEAALPLTLGDDAAQLRPMSAVESFFNHWSLLRNGRSLLRTRPKEQNEFACMDAVRTFSMAQVILGHTFVYAMSSIGYNNMEQFSPPHGLLATFWFQVVPGCFYGVDSFFVMSGFFCAYGMQHKVFHRPENRRPLRFSAKYLQFALFRWLRLIPAQMFCMAFVVTVLPHLGTGILWNSEKPDGSHCYKSAGAGQCPKYWWVNLLFLQDLDRFLGKCMSHTWYLANDFQLYLTAPFFALAYSMDKRAGWSLLVVVLIACMIVPTVQTSNNEWVPEILAGAFKGFDQKFYMKPWCRAPAFLIGIAMGWAWPWLRERFGQGPSSGRSKALGWLWAILGVGLCCLATFGRMAFWQCEMVTCSDPFKSPVPRLLQFVWGGFSIAAWCLGLAIIMVLCFLGRFLPLWQGLMHLPMWQPLAKLSYSAYLIHTSVLILYFCQLERPVTYSPSTFAFNFVSFTVCSLFAALIVYMLVEKPASNLQMKMFGGGGE